MADDKAGMWRSLLLIMLFSGSKTFGHEIYTNIWAVKVRGRPLEAKQLAMKHGFFYAKHVRKFLRVGYVAEFQWHFGEWSF